MSLRNVIIWLFILFCLGLLLADLYVFLYQRVFNAGGMFYYYVTNEEFVFQLLAGVLGIILGLSMLYDKSFSKVVYFLIFLLFNVYYGYSVFSNQSIDTTIYHLIILIAPLLYFIPIRRNNGGDEK
jgi:hypothetical protein